jgi:hypothetical protein
MKQAESHNQIVPLNDRNNLIARINPKLSSEIYRGLARDSPCTRVSDIWNYGLCRV